MTIDEQIRVLNDAADLLRQLRDEGHDLEDHPDYLDALGLLLTEVAYQLDGSRILSIEPLRAYVNALTSEGRWPGPAEEGPTVARILAVELAGARDYAERLSIDPIYALDPPCDNPDCPRCNGSAENEWDDLEDDPDNPLDHQEGTR